MTTSEQNDVAERSGWLQANFKNQLAWIVFLVSAGGILLTAHGAVITGDQSLTKREVFNILVPLFGTWVGTILAFYFSKENFESANNSVRQMAAQLTPEQAMQQTSVRQVMKMRGAIKAVVMALGSDEDKVTLKTLREVFDKGNSRAPILGPGDTIKYVIHDGTLAKFVADKALSQTGSVTDATKLSDMLPHKIGNEDFKSIVTKFACVGLNASLDDARNAMLAVKGAQDVFVTKTGRPDEAVEGWLTNVDFARSL